MASMFGLEGTASMIGGGRGELGRMRDAERLAAFRVHVDRDYAESLSTLIESEIIPRLMVAHAGDRGPRAMPDGGATIGADEVADFAPLALQVEADALLERIDAVLARGVPADNVLVDLLAPAARLLGEYWEEDRCDFVDVTMGLWRLQEIVHELSARLPGDRLASAGGYRALFASMPGDQHSFGTVVIDEVFRRDGWITDRMSDAETVDLVDRVAKDWFDLVGLTISCDCHAGALPAIVAALRNVSRNPRVRVMVGGRIFVANPALAAEVGADGTARDAKLALKVAAGLVRAAEREIARV